MLKFKYIAFTALIILVMLLICEPFFYISFWWYVMLFFLFFCVVVIGSFSMSWGLFLKAYTSNSNIKQKRIAITFDDGPNPKFTPKVLRLLKDYDAKATFFCIGKHIKKHPELLKLISTQGHQIGNHSYSHSNTIDFKSTEEWLTELKETDQVVFKAIGIKPALFRPPFGVTTPHLATALKVTGHQVIGWNNRPFDTAIKNADFIFKRIEAKVKPGSIILLHDKHDRIETVLEQLLQFLKSQDYQVVTIKELLDDN